MNMNMNKKLLVIVGSITLSLIIIILIAIILLENKTEKKNIQFSMNKTNTTNETYTQNEISNTTENTTEEKRESNITGEITYEETSDGGIIPVPPTFSYVEGDSQTGAVIEDGNGNQFVWVPVEDISFYNRQIFANNGENTDQEEIDNLNLKDINAYNEDYDNSVSEYKGFYIARFEAGKDDESELPVSKANTIPWTQIVWEKAKSVSMSMYEENDYFQTDLINSYAWDTTCNWMRNNNINIDDSTSYGNYQNSTDGMNKVVESGSNNRWRVNNIYDMAGNTWEYTTEEYGDHEKYHIGRGGGYWNSGDIYPISTRGTSDDSSNLSIGFRVVLYLK